jgi:hypothetical protein
MLNEGSAILLAQANSLGWPSLKEPAFIELRNRFVAGDATPDDVLSHIRKEGIWARAEFPDGRKPVFVGEAIPPSPGTGERGCA